MKGKVINKILIITAVCVITVIAGTLGIYFVLNQVDDIRLTANRSYFFVGTDVTNNDFNFTITYKFSKNKILVLEDNMLVTPLPTSTSPQGLYDVVATYKDKQYITQIQLVADTVVSTIVNCKNEEYNWGEEFHPNDLTIKETYLSGKITETTVTLDMITTFPEMRPINFDNEGNALATGQAVKFNFKNIELTHTININPENSTAEVINAKNEYIEQMSAFYEEYIEQANEPDIYINLATFFNIGGIKETRKLLGDDFKLFSGNLDDNDSQFAGSDLTLYKKYTTIIKQSIAEYLLKVNYVDLDYKNNKIVQYGNINDMLEHVNKRVYSYDLIGYVVNSINKDIANIIATGDEALITQVNQLYIKTSNTLMAYRNMQNKSTIALVIKFSQEIYDYIWEQEDPETGEHTLAESCTNFLNCVTSVLGTVYLFSRDISDFIATNVVDLDKMTDQSLAAEFMDELDLLCYYALTDFLIDDLNMTQFLKTINNMIQDEYYESIVGCDQSEFEMFAAITLIIYNTLKTNNVDVNNIENQLNEIDDTVDWSALLNNVNEVLSNYKLNATKQYINVQTQMAEEDGVLTITNQKLTTELSFGGDNNTTISAGILFEIIIVYFPED